VGQPATLQDQVTHSPMWLMHRQVMTGQVAPLLNAAPATAPRGVAERALRAARFRVHGRCPGGSGGGGPRRLRRGEGLA